MSTRGCCCADSSSSAWLEGGGERVASGKCRSAAIREAFVDTAQTHTHTQREREREFRSVWDPGRGRPDDLNTTVRSGPAFGAAPVILDRTDQINRGRRRERRRENEWASSQARAEIEPPNRSPRRQRQGGREGGDRVRTEEYKKKKAEIVRRALQPINSVPLAPLLLRLRRERTTTTSLSLSLSMACLSFAVNEGCL